MWGTRVSNGAVKPNGGETTLGGEVEGCIPTRLHQGLDPQLSLDNLDHRSTRQSTAPWCRRLPRILGGPKGPSADPGQVPGGPNGPSWDLPGAS